MPIEHLRWHETVAGLRDPIMLAAFVRKSGYGTTAVASLTHLVGAHDGKLIAELEPEPFFDFTVASPLLERRDEQRVVMWPQNRIYQLQHQERARDVVVLLGTEPHLRWGSFAAAVREFITEAGVREVVVVYSWPGTVPHTRPIFLRMSTEDAELARRVSLPPTPLDYVGPIDFATMLLTSLDSSVRAGGLSAIVPNYLGVVPNPFAMLALVEALDHLALTQTDVERIRELADQVRAKADESIQESAELAEAIRQMEQQYETMTDSTASIGGDDRREDALPSPEDLLRDVEAFLNRGKDDPA